MAKEKTQYVCNECGGTSPKWLGKCPHCNAWNTLIESAAESAAPTKNRFASLAKTAEVTVLSNIEASDVERTPTGHDELDRVLGGGIVEGGVVLIGGDPGIGKSTLLLQALDSLQRSGQKTLYVTGEESGAQVALRSRRLGLDGSQVSVLAEIQLEKILATLDATRPTIAVSELTATRPEILSSVWARITLKPNQPTIKIQAPKARNGMLEGGCAEIAPSLR